MTQQMVEKEREHGLKQARLQFIIISGNLISEDRFDQAFDMLDNFIGSVDHDSGVYRDLKEFRDSVHSKVTDSMIKMRVHHDRNLRIPETKDSNESELYLITKKGCRALYDYCFDNALRYDLIPKE